jgi:iron complex outermembrane recepter protein
MHPEATHPNPRAGRCRLAAAGLVSLATTLSVLAQTAPTTPAANDQPAPSGAVTTTTTTTTTPAAATASSDQPVVLNEFTVNGSYASSLELAAELKQNSNAIVEILAPEDIGVLPDVSIADDLVRLNGLTSERVNGRNQEITIRGLDPDFSVFTVDGVEQATSGPNRDAQYDQYPSELIGGATVYKTGQADLIGGIGGTVDLQFTSPLSADHRIIAVDAFYNWTNLGELTPGQKVTGESYSASYIDQFANGTEGIFVGYAHRESPYEGEQFQAWGYPKDSLGNLVLGGMRIYDQNDLLKSDSGVVVIESKPNDLIHNKLDLFFSYTNENQLLRGMEVPMAFWGYPYTGPEPGYTVTDGLITHYTLPEINPVVRNMDTQWLTHIASVIENLDIGEKTAWPVHFTAGWSSAKQSEEVLETYAGLGFNNTETDGDTFVVTQNAGPNPPSVVSSTNYANASLFSLTDSQGWGVGVFPVTGMEGYLKYFIEYDVADSYKLSTKHELDASIFKDVEFGANFSDRYKQYGQDPSGYLVNSNGQPEAALPPLLGTTNLSFIGNLHPIAYDPNAALDSGRYTFVPNPNPGSWEGDNYKVWEQITRPYAQFDLKGDLGPVPFDGNIGAMGDFTHQSSDGLSGNGGPIVVPVSGGASYATFLPSLNLIFKPTKQDFIRLFVGRQEMHPTMYQMRDSRDYSYDAANALSSVNSPWGATSGNPTIHPWLANSADLSLEHYFANGGGYIRIGAFEKKLLTYIYQANTVESFAGYPYTSATPPVLTTGVASQYVNGAGGNVTGLEADFELTSDALTHGGFRGLGLQLNGLLVDSSIQPWGPNNPSAPLPDMSKKSGTATLYYETHGFSARVSDHYQGVTREYIVQFGAPTFASLGTPNDGYTDEIPYHEIDAQISYAFKTGWFKGLTFYLEGRNLNDAPQITFFNNDPRQLANWQKYGASYRTGASYKF